MREEINRILKLVEESKLTGEQASAMIDALEKAERRQPLEADAHAGAGTAGRHRQGHRRQGPRGSPALRQWLDWVDETNSATQAKVEEPTGEDYKAEGNRIVVSELTGLSLRQAEFCDNTMHASVFKDIEVTNGPLSRNALRGSSLKRASFAASDVTGNTLNGASLSRIAVISSVFKDNAVNGAHIRDLDLQSAQIRSAKINGSKLKDITLTDGAKLDRVQIVGVVAKDWTLAATTLSDVKFATARVARLNANRASLTDCAFVADELTRIRDLTLTDVNLVGCEFVDCTFDGTTIQDVDAENFRFVRVDFTGMTIDSADRFKALASAADAA